MRQKMKTLFGEGDRGPKLRVLVFGAVALWAIPAHSQVCNSDTSPVSSLCITVSPTNPPPGSPLTVTASYCSNINTGMGTEFIVALNSNAASIQACPTSGQIFLVDAAGVNRNDTDPCAAAGQASGCDIGWYLNDAAAATIPCTNRSVTWVLVVPNNVAVGGTYNVVVQAGGYTSLRCGMNNPTTSNTASLPVTIPLPPPALYGVSKTVEESGTSVNPGDLLLFHIDYSYVNTNSVTITDTVPPNTTLVATGPVSIESGAGPGAGAGSAVT